MSTTTLAQEPRPFGRYILLDRMGAGGMAEVFRAVAAGAEGFQRTVVLKRILAERAQAPEFVDMFVQEARISALLHHPNIVQVFDFGQVDGSYFLAMELLRGSDLGAVIRKLRENKRPLPIPVAAFIGHQVALGLSYAHRLSGPDGRPLNILHRDVSPSNIMCLREGGVKLLDFGIAKAVHLNSAVARTAAAAPGEPDLENFKGKISYMAPETIRGQPQDGRVDIFALGTVLWESLTGRRLFYGKDNLEKVKQVLQAPIVPPSTLRGDIPEALDAIVLRALERDPALRYTTAADMADELEQVVQQTRYQSRMLPALLDDLFGGGRTSSQAVLTMITPALLLSAASSGTMTPVPATSPPRRKRAMGAAIGAALLGTTLLGGGGAWLALGSRRPEPPASGATHATAPSAASADPSTPQAPAAVVAPTGAGPAIAGAQPGSAAPVGSAVAPPAAGQIAVEPLPATASSGEPAQADLRASAPAEPRSKGGSRPRRHARRQVREGETADRIARGLPIDPFAEAANRRGRR